jgi:glycosyltransferase involved in cell wall biosynthesis
MGLARLLSIVVPAFNEERLLPRTIEAIRAAAPSLHDQGWSHEVIVCDNNSTDRTAAIARDLGAEVVFEPINQIARARNTGASVARGSWLLFLDADSRLSRELLAEAVALMDRDDVIFAGALVQLEGSVSTFGAVFMHLWNFVSRTLHWMAGSFVLVEATAFREVGGFNLQLFAGEELDLSLRLKAVARRRRKRVTIIARHPLTSSARRLELYTRGELLRFALRAVLRPRATITSRKACAMWYDGRR